MVIFSRLRCQTQATFDGTIWVAQGGIVQSKLLSENKVNENINGDSVCVYEKFLFLF